MADANSEGRYESLDGLRGIAALVVVVQHALLTSAVFAGVYLERRTPSGGFSYALTYSPLHLLWDGTEAVTVFFVLSGFVLALPFEGLRRQSWFSYYPRRLIRMFLPIWGGVAVAALLAALIPRRHDFASSWMNSHAHQLGFGGVLNDMSVLRGVNNLNTPLWSMQWEVLFSLLLPLFVLYGFRLRRYWIAKATLACAVGAVGTGLMLAGHLATPDFALKYLPVFALGVCLASVRDKIGMAFGRLGRIPAILLALLALLMINASWTTRSISTNEGGLLIASVLAVIGAALLVALFACAPAIAKVGQARWARWLGKISFSLYLIHEPIVVSVKNLWPSLGPGSVLAIALPLSLAAAWVFFKAVEAPASRLARRAGGAVERYLRREPSLLTPEPSLLTPEPSLLTPEPSLLRVELAVVTHPSRVESCP